MDRIKLIIILGPTATGKSRLAVELASAFNGEIIGADSMQVYRRMDIGTAKPTEDERKAAPHHMIDVVEPDGEYCAARYARDAREKIREIISRGKTPFVAGGTGLYIRALVHGICEAPAPDMDLRKRLVLEARTSGRTALHGRLGRVDPEAAAAIHPNNLSRVVRALEVYELTGRAISEFRGAHGFASTPYLTLKIGLTKDRLELYGDIEARVDRMVRDGLVEETRALLEAGLTTESKPMLALGYKEMAGYLGGRYTLEEAVRLLKMNTRRYAKRQMTWFRKEPDIRWFHPGQKNDIIDCVRGFLD